MWRGEQARGDLTRSTLANRRIRAIVGAFASITLGEWVLGTAVAVHAYSAGGALAVGLVGFRFAPAALAGVLTTQLAAHAGHRPILSLTAMTRTVVTALAALALVLGLPFGLVIALVWLDAAAGSGYRPAQAALLPRIARTPGELTATAAMVSNVKTSGQLLGALLGGALVALLPIQLPVACAAALYTAAALMTLSERGAGAMRAPLIGLSGVRTGLQTLRESVDARLIVGYSCMRSLVRGLWFSLAVVVCLELLSLGPSGFGVLMAAAAAGALSAVVLTAHLVGNRRLSGWMVGGLVLCGLPIVATGLADSSVPAVALMVIWGLGMALSDVGALTLLNRIIPGRSIGPLTGVMEGSKLLSEGFGSLLAPVLLALVGTRGAVITAGIALPLVVAAGYRHLSQIDDRAVARVDVLELLRGISFFKPLPLDALEGIAANLEPDHRPAETVIIRQGDVDAHDWFLVADGELAVEVDSFLVSELHRGDQFGERALLRGAPRAATVRAVSDVDLYRLEREAFLTAVGAMDLGEADVDHRSPVEIDPASALARTPLLSSVGPARLSELVEQSRVQTVQGGAAIVRDGDHDDTYHVLLSGRAKVIVGGAERAELLPGDAFGEIAILHRVARTADVIADEDSSVLTIDGEAVRAVLRDHADGAVSGLAL
jgi:CRP-like cAMP-binding protein